MRRTTLAIPSLALSLLASAARADDVDRLQGDWVMVSLEINGEEAPEDQVASARLTVEGHHYQPMYNEKAISESFRIDPEKTPKAIDFTYTDGPRKGEKVKGIYKLEGDRYMMCRPLLAEDPRPSEFATGAESGLVLVVWKRDTAAERARRKAIEDERRSIDGVWVGEFNRRDGKTVPEDEVKQVRLIMTGDRYTVERGGGKASRGTSKLDPTLSPKEIDISIIDGEFKGQHWMGIYELSSDTYRACFATVGKPRPKAFDSEAGSGNVLWVFRKEKN